MSNVSLFSLLFETEEYYKSAIRATGKLNSEESRLEFDRMVDSTRKNPQTLFYYDPDGLTIEAAKETSEPQNRGLLIPKKRFIAEKELVSVNLNEKSVILHLRSKAPLQDPRVALQISSLLQVFPEFTNFTLVRHIYDEKEQKNIMEPLGIVGDFLRNKKEIQAKTRVYNRDEREPSFEDFKYEVLKDITDVVWYHATKRSNLNSIKRTGLLPSKEFINPQQHGWTYLNMDLQNAVYLTHDLEYATQIAQTIADKFEEPSVVLKIDGKALSDYSKIVVDEDALRDEYTEAVHSSNVWVGMPAFMTSVITDVSSLGYTGTIPAQYIRVEKRIEPEPKKNINMIIDKKF